MTRGKFTLRATAWSPGYSSDSCDLVADFYEPAMAAAKRYDRAVGYFSSTALALIARGIQYLYLRNGAMRLIASPVMSVDDREAIRSGYQQRTEVFERRLIEYLEPSLLTTDARLRLELLTGMIADGLLDVRIAVREDEDGGLSLYHEKVGVFTDSSDDYITFIGSPNETWNGWVGNAESFALHTSWSSTSENAKWERGLFERTWEKERPRVPVYEITEAVRRRLFEAFPPRDPDTPANRSRLASIRRTVPRQVGFPNWLKSGSGLREYQREAVNSWLEASGRGVFAMATGTGKTITALAASTQLFNALDRSGRSLLNLVVVPTADLVAQWAAVAREFKYDPICCHSGNSSFWPNALDTAVTALSYGSASCEMVISTADTLTTPRFRALIDQHTSDLLVIGDEMHSLGTARRLAALPEAQYRLGLSATPRRHGDEFGTSRLLEYFGEVKQRIDIKQAIDLGALVPYNYEAILVPMTEDEMTEYKSLSARLAAMMGKSEDFEDFVTRAGKWLRERTRLLGHAQQKMVALERIMAPFADSLYNLVYVAEGTHPIYETRQRSEVVQLLGSRLGMRVNEYTGGTPDADREAFQRMLREGTLQALIAMRCLDEGIDIPEAQRGVILASTQNPRQFVQRRGRILRRHDEGGKKSADLIDLLVVPEQPPEKDDPAFLMERRLVGRELTRALELASASINGAAAPPEELVEVMRRYELLELLADYGNPVLWEEGGGDVYSEAQ